MNAEQWAQAFDRIGLLGGTLTAKEGQEVALLEYGEELARREK